MKAGNFKGALLEYIIRELLKSCGFSNVKSDGLYAFERSGLYFLNGKGAAHDADIIMNPPIQMPFAYPTQLIFECKAYASSLSLPIVRNALGLRNDLNDFEIVTKKSLLKRQNNRRADYAIEQRNRYLYQVGVASINLFTRPAVEFAANNKIPLISLSWFLSQPVIDLINGINQRFIDSLPNNAVENLYSFFKDRNGDINSNEYLAAKNLIAEEPTIREIIHFARLSIKYSYVGLLETGDLVFLFAKTKSENNILNRITSFSDLLAEIHWQSDRPNVWTLTVSSRSERNESTEFDFFVPDKILRRWEKFNFDKNEALNIKEDFFSKIFVFNNKNNNLAPFSIISIDAEWLYRARRRLNEQ
ncbi:hypothetical protein [Flavobacterium sp. GCM10023249]|uniref:hypothetical protein n=1 Tax=unclassified Flavobacterium TaxID=196869 RepID=UPI00361B3B77